MNNSYSSETHPTADELLHCVDQGISVLGITQDAGFVEAVLSLFFSPAFVRGQGLETNVLISRLFMPLANHSSEHVRILTLQHTLARLGPWTGDERTDSVSSASSTMTGQTVSTAAAAQSTAADEQSSGAVIALLRHGEVMLDLFGRRITDDCVAVRNLARQICYRLLPARPSTADVQRFVYLAPILQALCTDTIVGPRASLILDGMISQYQAQDTMFVLGLRALFHRNLNQRHWGCRAIEQSKNLESVGTFRADILLQAASLSDPTPQWISTAASPQVNLRAAEEVALEHLESACSISSGVSRRSQALHSLCALFDLPTVRRAVDSANGAHRLQALLSNCLADRPDLEFTDSAEEDNYELGAMALELLCLLFADQQCAFRQTSLQTPVPLLRLLMEYLVSAAGSELSASRNLEQARASAVYLLAAVLFADEALRAVQPLGTSRSSMREPAFSDCDVFGWRQTQPSNALVLPVFASIKDSFVLPSPIVEYDWCCLPYPTQVLLLEPRARELVSACWVVKAHGGWRGVLLWADKQRSQAHSAQDDRLQRELPRPSPHGLRLLRALDCRSQMAFLLNQVSTAASHEHVLSALESLDSHCTCQPDAIQTFLELQWQDAFGRFLKVLPSSVLDGLLLARLLALLLRVILSGLARRSDCDWLYENFKGRIVQLMSPRLDLGEGDDASPPIKRLLQAQTLRFMRALVRMACSFPRQSPTVETGLLIRAVLPHLNSPNRHDEHELYDLWLHGQALLCLGQWTDDSGGHCGDLSPSELHHLVSTLVMIINTCRGDRQSVSFVGKSLGRLAMMSVRHISARLRSLDAAALWGQHWLWEGHGLTWLVKLYADRDPTIRVAALGLISDLVCDDDGRREILAQNWGEGHDFDLRLVEAMEAVIMNQHEAPLARATALQVLNNLICCGLRPGPALISNFAQILGAAVSVRSAALQTALALTLRNLVLADRSSLSVRAWSHLLGVIEVVWETVCSPTSLGLSWHSEVPVRLLLTLLESVAAGLSVGDAGGVAAVLAGHASVLRLLFEIIGDRQMTICEASREVPDKSGAVHPGYNQTDQVCSIQVRLAAVDVLHRFIKTSRKAGALVWELLIVEWPIVEEAFAAALCLSASRHRDLPDIKPVRRGNLCSPLMKPTLGFLISLIASDGSATLDQPPWTQPVRDGSPSSLEHIMASEEAVLEYADHIGAHLCGTVMRIYDVLCADGEYEVLVRSCEHEDRACATTNDSLDVLVIHTLTALVGCSSSAKTVALGSGILEVRLRGGVPRGEGSPLIHLFRCCLSL